MKKKELIKSNENLKTSNNELSGANYSLRREIEELNSKLETKDQGIRHLENRVEELETILRIIAHVLAGEAEWESKAKVLYDLMPEAKEMKEDMAEAKTPNNFRRRRF